MCAYVRVCVFTLFIHFVHVNYTCLIRSIYTHLYICFLYMSYDSCYLRILFIHVVYMLYLFYSDILYTCHLHVLLVYVILCVYMIAIYAFVCVTYCLHMASCILIHIRLTQEIYIIDMFLYILSTYIVFTCFMRIICLCCSSMLPFHTVHICCE